MSAPWDLDMIAIPGDTPASTISAIIADEAAIGMVNNKTTAVRVIPAIGKTVGDELEFGGLFGSAPVMPVHDKSAERFVARGGKNPGSAAQPEKLSHKEGRRRTHEHPCGAGTDTKNAQRQRISGVRRRGLCSGYASGHGPRRLGYLHLGTAGADRGVLSTELHVVETGIKHGTVTVVLQGTPYEVTTFRTEGDYLDHRRPEQVQFVRSLREDLQRRDFTINAMAVGLDGEIREPLDGRNDLEHRLIRCVGDPERRFEEDALRILRGLRFAARLGFSIEAETAAAMERKKQLLVCISGERIYKELTGILVGKYARQVLERYGGILAGITGDRTGHGLPAAQPLPQSGRLEPYAGGAGKERNGSNGSLGIAAP